MNINKIWFRYQKINLFFLIVLLIFLTIKPVMAETAPDAGSTTQQIQENKPQLAKKNKNSITIQGQSDPSASSGSDQKIDVCGFEFAGELLVEAGVLQKLIQDSVGQEVTLSELNNIAIEVTGYLRSQGYLLAFAYIPAQEIKEGIVKISIVPGKYGEIKIEDQTHLSTERLQKMMELFQSGDIITKKSLERTLVLLNDIAGMEVKATLAPGKESGTANLLITARDIAKSNGVFTIDNWGNRFTGSIVYGTNIYINHLTAMGDYMNLVFQTSGSNLKTINLGYNIPLGYQGLRMDIDYSKMCYSLGEDFADLDATGESEITSVELKSPFIRSRLVNLYGITGYDKKEFEDDIAGADTHTPRSSDLWKIGFTGDFIDNWLYGGKTDYSLIYYNGDLDIKDKTSAAIDAATAETAGNFSKIKYTCDHLQYINSGLSLNFSLNGQYTNGNLDSSEKISLGGAKGVRVYPQGEAAGDQGYLITAELRQLIPRWSTEVNSFYLTGFYDYGKVKINKDPWLGVGDNKRSLNDIGIGFIWTHSDKYILRADYAHKLGDKEAVSDEDRNNRLWLRLVRYF